MKSKQKKRNTNKFKKSIKNKNERKMNSKTQRTSPIYLGQLISYLKRRSVLERVEFNLDDEFFIDYFNNGIRKFFGVTVDENGFPLRDEQQPNELFYEDFLCDYYLTNNGIKDYQQRK